MDVTVSGGETWETALRLLKLWRPRLSSGQQRQAERPGPAPPVQPKPPPGPAPPPLPAGWVPFQKIQPTDEYPPEAIRFEDGYEWSCLSWWSLVEGAIVWLHRRKTLAETHLPLRDKAGRPVIHSRAEAGGVLHAKPVQDTPFVLSKHGNAGMQLERFGRLLRTCGHSATSVFAKPR